MYFTEKGVNMDKQKLIEYLERVVELEKQVYLQERAIAKLDNRISSLGIVKEIEEPKKYKFSFGDLYYSFSGPLFGMIWIPALCAAISVIVIPLILTLFVKKQDVQNPGMIFTWSAVIGAIAGLIISIVWIIIRVRDEVEVKKSEEESFVRYNEAKHFDALRVKNELAQKKVLLNERTILYNRYQHTQDTLRKYYDIGVIYGKYQYDFVAVASFLDYLKSGMCQTLEERVSRDGAYNIYEELCRLDKIIYKLDEVINHLEEIKANQWTIYNAVQEGNRISEQLVDATNRLAAASEQTAINSGIAAENSAIAAYNSRQSANELNQIKWLQLYGMTLR